MARRFTTVLSLALLGAVRRAVLAFTIVPKRLIISPWGIGVSTGGFLAKVNTTSAGVATPWTVTSTDTADAEAGSYASGTRPASGITALT